MQIIEHSGPRLSDAVGGLADVLRREQEQSDENDRAQMLVKSQQDTATQKTASEQAKSRAEAVRTVLLNADSDPQAWGRAYAELQRRDPEAAKFIPDISTLPLSDFQQAKNTLRMQENALQQQQTQIRSGAAGRMIGGAPNRTDAAITFNPQSAGTAPYNQEQLADVLGGRFSSKPPSPDEMQAAKVETKIAPDAATVLKEKTEGPLRIAQADEAKGRATEARASAKEKVARANSLAATAQGQANGVQPGTPAFRVAQDIAYGVLPFRDFKNRGFGDAKQKMAIYDKARDLNPNFDVSKFELGYQFASNPKIRQQVSSADNALSRLDDAIRVSDDAARTGIQAVNGIVMKGGVKLGGVSYSNFVVAQKALGDEISGALGFGSATDMTRQLGLDMTDPTLSPEQFKGALEQVRSFLTSKRSALVNQMGTYGTAVNQFSGTTQPRAPSQKNRLQKEQRNKRTGETRTVYSDDGGTTWDP